MKIFPVLMLVALVCSLQSQALGADLREYGKLPAGVQELKDQEGACDCCQKCKAAKKPVISKEEEGGNVENSGCDDCCKRCGKMVPPAPDETPPEIMDKHTPPDIIEKQKL